MSALLALLILQLVSVNRAQDCLRASDGNRTLPNFVKPESFGEPRFRAQPIQAIITSYRFVCCGVITQWRAYVERSGNGHQDGAYSISFQVWRPNSPSPVDTDGCYTLTGVNHFPNIQLGDDLNRGLVNETPSVNGRIEVQPGDVIGFYLTSNRQEDDGILFAGDDDNDSPYNEGTVWYATGNIGGGGPPTCQFPVGTSRALSSSTNLAPLIRASVSTFICPTSTSTVAMYSTPIPSPTTTSLTTDLTTTEPTTTEPIVDESFPPTNTSKTTDNPIMTDTSTPVQEPELVDIGLIGGVTVPVIMVIILIVSVLVVILTCVVMKRRSKLAQESSEMVYYSQVNPVSVQTEEGPYYSSMETQPSITKNEAYGKLTQDTSTDVDTYYYVNDPSNDPTIPKSQNAVYGDIPTSTTTNDDSCEGFNEALTTNRAYGKVPTASIEQNYELDDLLYKNEAYGVTTGPSSSEYATVPANDGSIPTTANEAYISVSANDSTIQTTQNAAYGDISSSTTANNDQDYHVNERLNGPMTTNEAYGKVATANEHSDESLSENEAYGDTTRQDPANDSYIPTTENEAYTSVSANTDRMETEETYDYVRNL